MSPLATTASTVAEVIASLEGELRETETHAGRLRDTLTELRRIWEISPINPAHNPAASPVPTAETPKRSAAPAPAAAVPPAWSAKSRRAPAADKKEQMARVLQVAARMEQPFRLAQLHTKVIDINKHTLTDYVAQLMAAGAITKTGHRAGTKYTVDPRVDPARLDSLVAKSAPQTESTRATAKRDFGQLRVSLINVFDSGASYDMTGLIKGLRGVMPGVSEAEIQPVLLDLMNQRRIQQISTELGPRYRKKAA